MKLNKKKYTKVKFELLKTNHILIKAKLNGTKGRFILDTGASNSCISKTDIELFSIESETVDEKVAGVGTTQMEAEISEGNELKIKKCVFKDISIVVFDLSNINEALMSQDVLPVNGIIGADIFLKSKAVIDYKSRKIYFKKQ